MSGLQDINMNDYDLIFNVNLRSIVVLTRNCLEHLIAQKVVLLMFQAYQLLILVLMQSHNAWQKVL